MLAGSEECMVESNRDYKLCSDGGTADVTTLDGSLWTDRGADYGAPGQFHDLSKTFESGAHATGTGVKGKRDETGYR
jgi:hypothetical protein